LTLFIHKQSVADPDIRLRGSHHVADPEIGPTGGGNSICFSVSQVYFFIKPNWMKGHGRIWPPRIGHCKRSIEIITIIASKVAMDSW